LSTPLGLRATSVKRTILSAPTLSERASTKYLNSAVGLT